MRCEKGLRPHARVTLARKTFARKEFAHRKVKGDNEGDMRGEVANVV